MVDDFYNKYPNVARNKHEFSISRAIMAMVEENIELNKFVNGDFDLGINFATSAWNLAIINDRIMIKLLIKTISKVLKTQSGKTQKQIEAMLNSLIKLKEKLYPEIFRYIHDYSSAPDTHGKPCLRVVSGDNMSSDYFANKYREILFCNQKYGWVKENGINIAK